MHLRPILASAIAVAATCFPTQPAWAWGDNGHKIICEIAFQELTPTAKQAVAALIRDDAEFRFFNDACTWPDHPRKRRTEHYVNVTRDAPGLTEACPSAPECVVSAIMKDIIVLATVADDRQKLDALKFLGHWVGDIHQPLHVAFEDDRGGNSIRETGPCTGSLHAVWDSCILEMGLGVNPLEVAIALRESISDVDRAVWIEGEVDVETVIGWANESYAVAIAPVTEYCVSSEESCWYSADKESFETQDEEKEVRVDQNYITRATPIVAARLQMAGVRLAAILNQVFSD